MNHFNSSPPSFLLFSLRLHKYNYENSKLQSIYETLKRKDYLQKYSWTDESISDFKRIVENVVRISRYSLDYPIISGNF